MDVLRQRTPEMSEFLAKADQLQGGQGSGWENPKPRNIDEKIWMNILEDVDSSGSHVISEFADLAHPFLRDSPPTMLKDAAEIFPHRKEQTFLKLLSPPFLSARPTLRVWSLHTPPVSMLGMTSLETGQALKEL